jgi:hypothetical protein
MSKPERDIVLVLGAGFSADAELPIMTRFAEASKKEFASLTSGSNQDRYVTGTLLEAGRVYNAFVRYCQHSGHSSINTGNLESVFCAAESLHEANVGTIEIDGQPYSMRYILDQIQVWLWKIYNQCPPLSGHSGIDARPYTREPAYDGLAQAVVVNGLANRLTVITTNYDLIFEYFAIDNGLHVAYPFRSRDVEWLRIFDEASRCSIRSLDNVDEAAVVTKLHGSVNFFVGLRDQPNRLAIFGQNAIAGEQIGKSIIPANPSGKNRGARMGVFAVDALWSLQAKFGGGLVPAIIPPTYAKLQGYEWLRQLWHAAYEGLRDARLIIFIGYSMPPSDGFIRSLIQVALTGSRHAQAPEILLLSPRADTLAAREYADVFGHISVSPEPGPLREGWQRVADALKRYA